MICIIILYDHTCLISVSFHIKCSARLEKLFLARLVILDRIYNSRNCSSHTTQSKNHIHINI